MARKAAKAWFDEHLRPITVASEALGRDVGFNRVGRDKFVSQSADPRKIALLAAVRDVVERGRLLRSEPPNGPGLVNIKAVHHLAGDVDLAGDRLPVRAVVRETKSGDFYYTHYIEDDPAGPGARFDPATKRGDGTPGGGTGPDMGSGADAVNRPTPDQLIAADPDLKALADDTARLAAENGCARPPG